MTRSNAHPLTCNICGGRTSAASQEVSTTDLSKGCAGCGTPPGGAVPDRATSTCVVSTRYEGGIATVVLRGELDLRCTSVLCTALTDACERCRHVVLDLDAVTLIDSAALGALVRVHQDAKRHEGFAVLVRPSRFVTTVLHTMRLLRVFPVFPNTATALGWLRCVDSATPEDTGATWRMQVAAGARSADGYPSHEAASA